MKRSTKHLVFLIPVLFLIHLALKGYYTNEIKSTDLFITNIIDQQNYTAQLSAFNNYEMASNY